MSESREISWLDLVQKAEGDDFWRESLYPVVYVTTGGRRFRDTGPESGIYEKNNE